MTRGRWIAASISLAFVLVAVYFAASWIIVQQAVVAETHDLDQFPEEYGLTYEEVSFLPRGGEGITLRGWWLPAGNEDSDAAGTIISVHGLDEHRAARLPFLRDLVEAGFNVLTFDLRGHGRSDEAPLGAGHHEQNDVRGAIDYLLNDRGIEPGTLFLIGRSFGAGISLMVGADEPAVAGVYVDSAWSSLGDMVTEEVARRTRVPAFGAKLLKPGLVLMGRISKGIDLDAVRPAEAASRYDYIIGIVHCHTDERIPFHHAWTIRQNAPLGSFFEAYPCGHADGYEMFPEQYLATVIRYLNERIEAAQLEAPAS